MVRHHCVTLHRAFLIAIFLASIVGLARGHGRLTEPASRASLWRNPDIVASASAMGIEVYNDYDDNSKNCGGFWRQWELNEGKCGICGDPWDSHPRPQEDPYGDFAKGIIVKEYTAGDVILVNVHLTANHLGWFQFRLCPDPATEATHECLDTNILQLADGSGTKFVVIPHADFIVVELRLPVGLTCNHCVFQWKYHAGNNWGFDPVTGQSCLGCKPEQEEFYACADVRIIAGSDTVTGGNEPSTSAPTTTTGPTCEGAGTLKSSLEVAERCLDACASGCCPAQLCSDACRGSSP